MAVQAALLLALCALAAAASASVQPAPFGSFHALRTHGADRQPGQPRSLRVVNGNTAAPGQFPHQVGIYVDMSAFCGGALIHPNWVLTAATCVSQAQRFTAFLGAQNINLPAEKGRIAVTTTRAYTHDDFDSKLYKNDIALLLLPREVKLTDHIKTVSLPPRSYATKDFADAALQLSGWGYQKDGAATISPSLRYVDLKGTDKKTCVSTYSYEVVHDYTLCCKGDNKASPCQGDTGGALVEQKQDGTAIVVAVASFTPGKGCSTGKPSGFTKVASFLDWIADLAEIPIQD
ncbi:brachyurin-like [Thrips palmi]|uniref:Brachyurin-like n=1 Tax=Thrips palmi TaxID=161013 RepID=A0A6P8Z4E2_THRPL|nr:brachyurin-like [Thrips palmi]